LGFVRKLRPKRIPQIGPRTDSSRRSIRRQQRVVGRRGDAPNLSDAFDEDGLFHFEDTDASNPDAKPNPPRKK
jgi:hypothetical protein